jgi:hypothetical protein
MMDTVLFTDQSILVFVIIASATALLFSVLGLATTHQTRSDIGHEFGGGNAASTSLSDDPVEWNLVKEQFHALVRDRSDNFEDFFDVQFRGRFSDLIYQTAKRKSRTDRHAASLAN